MVDLYLYVPGFGVLEAIAEGLDGDAVNLAGDGRIQLTGNAYNLELEYGKAIVSAIGCETLSKGPNSDCQVVDFDLGERSPCIASRPSAIAFAAMCIALLRIFLASAVRVGNRLDAV